ncbi:MAG: nuclear transport factor 2 family protein [Paucibacter sp.]|nr:nuclear transport factor 2 family protein [Roseateles sp.]
MSGEPAELALVRRFWALYQARNWSAAEALLHPQAVCKWWATSERFDGAAAIVHVNAVYPEGWTIHLLELNALDGSIGLGSQVGTVRRVHSLVRVEQGSQAFYANSFFSLAQGLILAIDEYWADTQPAPAWRLNGDLPGASALGADVRAGLPLKLDSPSDLP